MSSQALRAVATGQRTKTIFDYLSDKRVADGISAVATKFLEPDRMLRLCVNAVKRAPKLAECNPQTVLGAMMTSAALGLEPNTVLQQAFLIPYKRRAMVQGKWTDLYDCQFQIGARGFITLAYRSPYIKSLTHGAIHKGDRWEHMDGSETFLRHSINLEARGDLIGAFSHAHLVSGGESACVLPLSEVHKIRGKSETYRSLLAAISTTQDAKERDKAQRKFDEQPWVMWEDDMAAKSATKKHAKILPIGSGDALAVAAELDNRSDTGAGRIDLKTLADPDAVRELVGGLSDVPAIDDESGEPAAEFGEAFGSTARAVESVGMVQTVAHSGAQPANASARELPAFDLQALRERIAACRDQDTLDALVDEARGQPPEVASLISADYERRSAELANPTPAGGASPQAAAASAASSARTSVPAARRGGSTPVQGTIE